MSSTSRVRVDSKVSVCVSVCSPFRLVSVRSCCNSRMSGILRKAMPTSSHSFSCSSSSGGSLTTVNRILFDTHTFSMGRLVWIMMDLIMRLKATSSRLLFRAIIGTQLSSPLHLRVSSLQHRPQQLPPRSILLRVHRNNCTVTTTTTNS